MALIYVKQGGGLGRLSGSRRNADPLGKGHEFLAEICAQDKEHAGVTPHGLMPGPFSSLPRAFRNVA
jgi:hypothetical protein